MKKDKKALDDLDAEFGSNFNPVIVGIHMPGQLSLLDDDEKLINSVAKGLYGADLIPSILPTALKYKHGKLDENAYDGKEASKLHIDECTQWNQPDYLKQKQMPDNDLFKKSATLEKAWVGVDPGKSGAISVMDSNGKIVYRAIMPLIGDDVNIHELYKIFAGLKLDYELTLILEDVHSIFGSSAASNFTFGFVCGAIEAIVISHSIKLIKVQPKSWQKEIWQNADKCYKPKKPEQKNPSLDTKATSLKAAIRMFPTFDFRKPNSLRSVNAHDGIVDAVLICEYGRRKNL